MRKRCSLMLILALTLAGCGAKPVTGVKVKASASTKLGGHDLTIFGAGAEGGSQPALLERADGSWVLVYAGGNVGDRQLYLATSTDGTHWGTSKAVAERTLTDQAPALVEDDAHHLHLFFTSNRDGEDFQAFHAEAASGVAFGAAAPIADLNSTTDLAVAYHGGRFLLAAEITGEGLFATTSADGATWTPREKLAASGFEPAATFDATGNALVAYQRSGTIFVRSSAPGADWATEATAATGTDRLREPALAWHGDHGVLTYVEREDTTYHLRERRFDAKLKFTAGRTLPDSGDDRSPAVVMDHNGETALAWGMKSSSGQSEIALTVLDD